MTRSGLRAAGIVAACLTMAACNSTSSGQSREGGNLFEALLYGGSVPTSGQGLASDAPCPTVTVAPGGAAINSYGGGREGSPEALRSQVSIVNLARECVGRPDGSIVIKVGVEGRALIGPAGSAGRFEAPVRFAIKSGNEVLASSARRAAVALSPGQTQGTFLVVEEGLVVPPGAGAFDIEVALGGSGAAERPARRGRRG
jgi:hypothetical protein